MVDWQITATTIYCDAVADEVTFMVYGDGTVFCTGEKRYGTGDKKASELAAERSRETGRKVTCAGCPVLLEHARGLLGGGVAG